MQRLIATCVATAALGGLAGPTAAAAATPEPFKIIEYVNFTDGGLDTFTTSGGSLCDSGTFEDFIVTFGGNPERAGTLNVLVRTVYTCADGSGTFYAQKNIFVTFGPGNSRTNTGPFTFHGGTGDYTKLTGHGVDVGTASGDQGIGTITGVLTLR